MRDLIVGDIVKLKKDLLDNPAGSEGVVYEVYKIEEVEGVSIIFENGEYDGFSKKDQVDLLERAGHKPSLKDYKFQNVQTLTMDYINGMFDITSG